VKIFNRAQADLAASESFFAKGLISGEQKSDDVQYRVVSFWLTLDKRISLRATVSDWPKALADWEEHLKPGTRPKAQDTNWTITPSGINTGFDTFEDKRLNERQGTLAARDVNKKRTKLFFDRFRTAIDECMALPFATQ
jgi:hypothetical protein